MKEKQKRKLLRRKNNPLVVSDIEASQWINFLCIGWYNGSEYYWFDSIEEYLYFIFSQVEKNPRIYFHFGGGYDMLFILDFVFQENSLYEFVDGIPRGSSFLSITVREKSTNKKITFLDSSALLPFSLKSLAENFDVEVKKGEIDHNKTTKITDELLDYMMDDHLALWQVLDKYRNHEIIKSVGLKLTRSSQCFALYTKKYLKKKIIPLRNSIEAFCRQAYQGGRTEIFKPLLRPEEGKILRRYDVNSLYPAVMKNHEYPIALSHIGREFNPDDLSIVHCKVYVPMMKIPPLGAIIDGKYIFPVGTFSGHWTNKELAMALKYGVKILEVYKSVHFKNGGKIFLTYISEMYKRRKAKTSGPVDNIIYKDMMNHLYGRFALNLERHKVALDSMNEGSIRYMEINNNVLVLEPVELKSTTFVPISVFVTSYARIMNYEKFIKPNEDIIYYTDTDSFDVLTDLPSSNELGALKLEKEVNQACYVLPKAYILGDVKKIKGFSKDKVKILEFGDFLNYLEGQGKIELDMGVKMLKFKESLRRNKKILSISEKNMKRLKHKYNKRNIIIKNGNYDTEPIFINEQ